MIIEDDALIAGGCYISDNNHSIDPEGPQYAEQPLTFSPTTIGKGVWLGQNVCVLAGANIGERSIIGAGSVVRGIIPPYSIAVGAPARVIKRYSFKTKQWVPAKSWKEDSGVI
ncbi:acyltransferase [Cohnella sp.]|uniref:acyltransferase n=1 Tax=Cohnella sp. TaxID=1883426 RepID=UPI00356228C6